MKPYVDVDAELDRIKRERQGRERRDDLSVANWPEPKPLPDGLLSVENFNPEFLPETIRPWAMDIADRLQCPPDYVAVTAMVALGSVIGRRCGIRPQAKTDWTEIPNLWGGFIGRPGMLKSPAMMEALRPLHRLEKEAAEQYAKARTDYQAKAAEYKLKQQVAVTVAKEEMKKRVVNLSKVKEAIAAQDISFDVGDEPTEPTQVRFCTNDTSYEALGEILKNNPTGLLIGRDELISLLRHLDREEQVVARGFFLSGWSGTQPYTFDRIGRGTPPP